MKAFKILLFLLLALFVSELSIGQGFVFSGTLKDSLTSETLSFATLHNKTNNTIVQSDESGKFALKVDSGINVIKIIHIGCEAKIINIFVSKSISDSILYMAHHMHELHDVVITDIRENQAKSNKDKLNINEILTSGHKNISSIIEKIPGVATLNTGYSISKPVINGMFGSRVTVINNEIKMEGQQWGNEHGLEIDAYNVYEVLLVKGAETMRYSGDAIGGILLLRPFAFFEKDTILHSFTINGADNGMQGNISIFSQYYKLYKNGVGKGLLAKISSKKSGDLKSPGYYLQNTGFEEQNFNLALRIFKNKKHTIDANGSLFYNKIAILKISHFGNLQDLKNAIEQSSDIEKGIFSYEINRPFQRVFHTTAKVKWEYKITDLQKIELIYSLQLNKRKEYDSHNYINKTKASMELELITQQGDLIYEKKIKKTFIFKTGMSGSYQKNNYQGRYFIPNYMKYEINQFSILKFAKSRHEAEFGYRTGNIKYSVYKWEKNIIENYKLNYAGVSFQAVYGYKINHDMLISIYGGRMWRNPNINELFSNGLHHGTASIEYGDLNLKKEISGSVNLLFRYIHNKTLIETEIYTKTVKNYIYIKPKFPPELTIRGAFPAFYFAQTDVLINGAEVFFRQKLYKNIYFKEKIQLLNFKDLNSDTFINYIPPYSFNHSILINLSKNRIFNKSEIELSFRQVLKQSKYTINTDYMPPPDAYFLINLMFSGNISEKIFVFGGIENIMNKRYRNYMNRLRYFADEPGRIINIGLKIKI